MSGPNSAASANSRIDAGRGCERHAANGMIRIAAIPNRSAASIKGWNASPPTLEARKLTPFYNHW